MSHDLWWMLILTFALILGNIWLLKRGSQQKFQKSKKEQQTTPGKTKEPTGNDPS